jgi:ABC1 atypical kinase-like domain
MADRAQIDAAHGALGVLRSMRGAAGALAQLADFVDPAWAPEAERDRVQALLDDLRRGAPEPVPFKRVERILRDAWGGRVSEHLADLDPEPAARASAGQVHRGELDDGRAVAVKVLHPGAEEALRADLSNLTLLAQLATAVLPGLDARAVASELRDRALEELDLEHEAQSQRVFARAYRGHPFILVPAPVTELSHTQVLVSEWVDGAAFDEVLLRPAAERDRYGEILARFHAGAMLHLGAFHADPHPGNHRLLADGRVAFVDYGAVGRADPAWLAGLLDLGEAVEAGDGARIARELAALGYLSGPGAADPGFLAAHARASAGPLLSGAPVTARPALAQALLETQADAEDDLRALLPAGRLPARDLQAGRMIGGLSLVLARLEATAPWGAIAREPRAGGEPATALGAQEAAFWTHRGHSRGAAVLERRRAA